MKGEDKNKKKVLDILAGSDDDSDAPAEDNSKIQINEEYARRFEHNKRREALQRREEQKKKGIIAESDDEDEDDDESSDEDVAAASRRVDRRVLQVIRRIRSGDSAIFDPAAKVYSSSEDEDEADAEGEPKAGKAKKERPLYLKDVNAQHLLEEGPEFAAQTGRGNKYDRIAYDERQREGLKEFLEAEKKELGDGDGEEDDLFMEKRADGDGGESEDDEDEKQTEELLGEVFGDDDELDENEKFLKDYILNRPYLETGTGNNISMDAIEEVSEEEAEIEKWENYEDTYNAKVHNFRHEEMAASEAPVTDRVMGHPRVVEGSVRKKESSRKKQRKSKEERNARVKQEQAEELKHLKNLKRKEIFEKLEKIRMIAGIEGDAACKLGADDLEEDFDPEDYDRKMREMFDDKYYGADEVDPGFGSGDDFDLGKPDFDKEDEVLGLPKDWALDDKEGSTASGGEKKKKKKKNKELVDADEVGEGEKKKKKKNKELVDGDEVSEEIKAKISVELEKELDEYYKLDYEDTIGDLKTRFKYRQVQPNNYGLKTMEILQADDRDLNQYVSIKKLAPYREDEWHVTHHQKMNKALILGGQKKEDKKVIKAHKKSKTEEGPSFEKPRKDKLTSDKEETFAKTNSEGKKVKTGKRSRSEEDTSSEEPEKDKHIGQEETDAKEKSTRSKRRNRRRKELHIPASRRDAYGI
jgi:protein KRI1